MRIVSPLNVLVSVMLAFSAAPGLLAQSYNDEQDFQQTVARVAWQTGESSLQRGDDPDHWQRLAINVPLTNGDRVYTGRTGRLELEAPGFRAFVAPGTELTTLNMTENVQQYAISQGTATFRLTRRGDGDVIEIDTPNAAITLQTMGLYRITVDENGNTLVAVRRGAARVAEGGGDVSLRQGQQMRIDGLDAPEYDVFALTGADSWDRWVDSREQRRQGALSYKYTSADVLGAGDLDAYGRWQNVPEYGRVWAPSNVGADWAPYRLGRWIWQDPWGWTWVSDEPWGWAPYHYGRWVTRASRWYWVPVAPSVRRVAYAPALVAFVGGGPGWSASVTIGGGGYVGWFPLGPRDPVVRWWGSQTRAQIPSGNVVYSNRAYVTVVNHNTFVSAQPAQTDRVRDARILKEVGGQAVLRGPLPVLPTAQSIRPAFVAGSGPRPSEQITARPVAARLAPPPAPPTFKEKINVIRENHGAPMAPQAASSQPVQSKEGARATVPMRPVARDSNSSRESEPKTRAPQGAATSPAVNAEPPAKPVPPQAKPMPPARGRDDPPAQPAAAAPSAHPAAFAEPAPRKAEQSRPTPRVQPLVQLPPQPQAKPQAQPQVQQEAKPQGRSQPQAEAKQQVQPQAQPQAKQQPQQQVQPQAQPQAKQQPQQQVQPQAQPQAKQQPQQQVQPQAQPQAKQQAKQQGDKDKGDKEKKEKPEKPEKDEKK